MKKMISVAALVCFSHLGQSSVVQFDMSDLSGVTEDPWFEGVINPNAILTRELTRHGLVAVNGVGDFRSTNWSTSQTFIPEDRFISFVVRPGDGYEFLLTGLRINQSASASAPATLRVQLSFDGFSSVWKEADFTATATTTQLFVDLDQSVVPSGTDLEFRLYAFGQRMNGADSTEAGAIRLGNLVLEGVVAEAVPEAIPFWEGPAAELIFTSEAGRSYSIQFSEDLTGWQTIDQVAGTGESIHWFASMEGVGRGFFRVLSEP